MHNCQAAELVDVCTRDLNVEVWVPKYTCFTCCRMRDNELVLILSSRALEVTEHISLSLNSANLSSNLKVMSALPIMLQLFA